MTKSTKRWKTPATMAFGALACALAGPAPVQTAVLALSPDVTLELGPASVMTTDHGVALDNLDDVVVLEDLGPIPESTDLTGYASSGARRRYFTVATTVTLPGNVTVRPADVAYWDLRSYGLAFDSRLAGIPDGVAVDALDLVPEPNTGLMLAAGVGWLASVGRQTSRARRGRSGAEAESDAAPSRAGSRAR